ncbi:unnamed protein product [Auanema sp. JU1783]|nr:unnamed protein product [Auanema sp. JU1783]
MMAPPPVDDPNIYLPIKIPLLAIALLQLATCVIFLVKVSMNIAGHYHLFINSVMRYPIFIGLAALIIWMFTFTFVFYVIITNRYIFLIPHIVYTIFIAILTFIVSNIFIFNDTEAKAILSASLLTLFLLICIYYEIKCYQRMKKYVPNVF